MQAQKVASRIVIAFMDKLKQQWERYKANHG